MSILWCLASSCTLCLLGTDIIVSLLGYYPSVCSAAFPSPDIHLQQEHVLYMFSVLSFAPQAIFMIPTKPPPTLKEPEKFSNEFSDFISSCLVKNPEQRLSATALLQHRFIKSAKNVSVLKDLIQHAMKILEEEEGDGSVSLTSLV